MLDRTIPFCNTFSHYENEYEKAMTELGKIVTAEQYERLKQLSQE